MTDDDERRRIQQSNDAANLVFKVMERHGIFAYLDLRYGIADELWDAGFRKSDGPSPLGHRYHGNDSGDTCWHKAGDGICARPVEHHIEPADL